MKPKAINPLTIPVAKNKVLSKYEVNERDFDGEGAEIESAVADFSPPFDDFELAANAGAAKTIAHTIKITRVKEIMNRNARKW
ncbi:7955_t:CDS:2 [Acaulospora morrowiae]|uniref:7955_t:CDS:1 n=1 Tax=Acaulospora morrowiae TaxID=94023 RepID=A0A9N9A5N2_9GLOM|nr:7955_t:CDS:2 [Acaulospora morrowiae]